jgi:hypothetical protein
VNVGGSVVVGERVVGATVVVVAAVAVVVGATVVVVADVVVDVVAPVVVVAAAVVVVAAAVVVVAGGQFGGNVTEAVAVSWPSEKIRFTFCVVFG